MHCKCLNGTHTVMQSEINIGASSGAFLNASLSKNSFFVSVAIINEALYCDIFGNHCFSNNKLAANVDR